MTTTAPTSSPRRRGLLRRLPWVFLGLVALLQPVAPAWAATGGGGGCVGPLCPVSGSSTGTVTVVQPPPPPVRSITVSRATFAYTSCANSAGVSTPDGLHVPNGSCLSDGPFDLGQGNNNHDTLTVTNGPVASKITESTTALTPSDAGQSWTPCDPQSADIYGLTGPACTGSAGGFGALPGPDQATVLAGLPEDYPETLFWVALGSSERCSALLYTLATCPTIPANEAFPVNFLLYAPSSSTDTSATFSHTITWTAGP